MNTFKDSQTEQGLLAVTDMTRCPDCAEPLSLGIRACTACGIPLRSPAAATVRLTAALVGLAVLAYVVAMVLVEA